MKTITKMTIHSVYYNLLTLPGAVLSGFSVYFVLSHLLVPLVFTISLSVIISVLVFGLASYYGKTARNTNDPSSYRHESSRTYNDNKEEGEQYGHESGDRIDSKSRKSAFNIFFTISYIISLIIVGFVSHSNTDIFLPWEHTTAANIVQLIAAIAISFFLPGYALTYTIDRKHELEPILKILLSYIFSILITGLTGYVMAASGFPLSHVNIPLVIVYSVILIAFVSISALSKDFRLSAIRFVLDNNNKKKILLRILKRNRSEFLVFASLFSLVILSTYYLYGSVIIGDQWFHHGRSLMFISGAFKDLAAARVDVSYPPFFSAMLASFFTLTGIPSVNAYASIDFLNIIPVLAFYYFFTKWFPAQKYNRSPALIACTLFMLSAGWGWAHVINMATNSQITSQIDALNTLQLGGIKSFDIRLPSTFIDVGHPDITTGLIIIALPAGFILLGMIKQKISNKIKYVAILSAVLTLGVLIHDEFNLFIIFASVTVVVLSIRKKNSIFAACLFALVVAVLIDIIFPGKYYTTREFFKIPLIVLYISFVVLMWVLYATKVWRRVHYGKTPLFHNIVARVKIKSISKIFVVSAVAYLYVFTFIVWSNLSTNNVHAQTLHGGQRDIPWYLYPIKLGIAGLLGLAFILSYLFKRFEKDVLVFGIIALISLLAGPYYDENRMSKYIMVGMVGFASLLVYRMITHYGRSSITSRTDSQRSFIIRGLLIGLVITSSSLSVLMYTSYSVLGLENPDYKPFYNTLTARHFPSFPEIYMFKLLYNSLLNLKIDNIAEPTYEIGINQGLVTKLEGFSGVPSNKLYQSPLTINASTIEGLYNLLNYTNTRYILLPKNDINARLPYPVKFALSNFEKSYEDEKYVMLAVPHLSPPSTNSDIGLIYGRNGLYSSLYNQTTMQYDSRSFASIDTAEFQKVGNGQNVRSDSTKGQQVTMWSNNIGESGINYIEGRFHMIDENNASNHNIGIVWDNGNYISYALVTDKGLAIYNPTDNTALQKIITNPLEKGVWYTLKIAFTKNTTDIYVNDVLQSRTPRNSGNQNVLRVGLSSLNSMAEFEPIKIGQISEPAEQSYLDYHYYALSGLALSNVRYDVFDYGDFSAFSKKNLVLAFDPLLEDSTVDRYLEYANKGGTVIVFNSNNNTEGIFSKILSIQSAGTSDFNSIGTSSTPSYVRVSGTTNNIVVRSPNAIINSYYFNDHQIATPFVIEKDYGNGKIIFVNAYGYFRAISKTPSQFFSTLANVPNLIDLSQDRQVERNLISAMPPTRFIGEASADGLTTINTYSIGGIGDYSLQAEDLVYKGDPKSSGIIDKSNNQLEQDSLKTLNYKNIIIRNIQLTGPIRVSVNSKGFLYSPSSSFLHPNYDYIPMSVPTGFNMTLELLNGANAKFMVGNDTEPIHFTNGIIQLHGIKGNPSDLKYVSVLIKNPQINIRGNANFDEFYSNDPNDPTQAWASGDQLKSQGRLVAEFDHADNYNNASGVQYVTYLKQLHIDGYTNIGHQELRIPGDISNYAKAKGIELPLKSALFSSTNAKVLVTIAIITIASTFVVWSRTKRTNEVPT